MVKKWNSIFYPPKTEDTSKDQIVDVVDVGKIITSTIMATFPLHFRLFKYDSEWIC